MRHFDKLVDIQCQADEHRRLVLEEAIFLGLRVVPQVIEPLEPEPPELEAA